MGWPFCVRSGIRFAEVVLRKLSVSIRAASLWFSLVCRFSSAQNKGDLAPWQSWGSWKES